MICFCDKMAHIARSVAMAVDVGMVARIARSVVFPGYLLICHCGLLQSLSPSLLLDFDVALSLGLQPQLS